MIVTNVMIMIPIVCCYRDNDNVGLTDLLSYQYVCCERFDSFLTRNSTGVWHSDAHNFPCGLLTLANSIIFIISCLGVFVRCFVDTLRVVSCQPLHLTRHLL